MDSSQRSDITQSVHRSSGSFELVVGAAIFSLIGLLVDRAVGTTPLFMVLFAFAGFIGAALSIYYRYKYAMAEHGRPGNAAEHGRPGNAAEHGRPGNAAEHARPSEVS